MEEAGILATILSDSKIRAFAGATYYQRGVDYFHRNLVSELAHSGDVLEAVVRGTEDYGVRFVANGKRFEYTCECPLGDDGEFCKHCVATALAWLADRSGGTGKTARPRPITDKDIEAALAAQEKEKLIATLLEWSRRDKDAVAVYLRLGEQSVAAASNSRYEDAVELLKRQHP
jgi:uncharacterized Zn finger protein